MAVEYPVNNDDSIVQPPHRREKGATKHLFSILKILVTGIAIPVFVSLVTSFYVNTRLLKPRLRADYSWAMVMVIPIKDHPNDFVAALVDLYSGLEAPLPPGKRSIESVNQPLDFSGGEIVVAKRLRFKSKSDFVVDSSPSSSRIDKVMLVNDGYATANNISIGLRFQDGLTSKIVPSPNIKISQEAIAGTGVNPPFVKVEIERLGPGERAVLTASSTPTATTVRPDVDSTYVKIHEQPGYPPIVYITSTEGIGSIGKGISWKETTTWEETNFPNSVIGFWASRIHPRKGVSPSIEDLKNLEMHYDAVDNDEKPMGQGVWKLNPSN